MARAAQQLGCRSVAFTYNDPVVWAEYAHGLRQGMPCGRREDRGGYGRIYRALARETFFEVMDAANVDLKGFTEDFYRELTGGRLAPVQETLRWLCARATSGWR